jgi:hypothetical protein
MEHMALHGFDLDEEQAYDLLDRWRKYGIVRDESLAIGSTAQPLTLPSSEAIRQTATAIESTSQRPPILATATTATACVKLRGCHVDASLARDVERSLPPRVTLRTLAASLARR